MGSGVQVPRKSSPLTLHDDSKIVSPYGPRWSWSGPEELSPGSLAARSRSYAPDSKEIVRLAIHSDMHRGAREVVESNLNQCDCARASKAGSLI
jgi:hypothetical protein